MKKFLLLLAVVAMLLPGCKKIEESIDALENRIDKLEQETIPTIDEQIAAINVSLDALDATDKELKGYIDGLQATADNLQEQINATNTKIDEVKTALQNEISTAKAEVLAELEALETELKNELSQINATIETLKAKDAELDKKIADLRTYVDTELGKTTDWVNATFATLEQYNALVTEVTVIKAQIVAINDSIADLETRLTTKINEDIATAVANLNSTILQKVKEITEAYTAAVKTAKEELTAAYTAAIATAIANLETSLRSWVGEQLSNYYTIAEIDAKIATLEKAIADGDKILQDELNELKSQLETTKQEITEAYKKAIEEAIETNNGVINTKIASEIAAVNKRIDEEVAAINTKIANIEARLDELEDKVDDLVDKITGNLSISFDIEEDAALIAGSTVKVNYTITNSDSECHIATIAQNGWSAVVTKSREKEGYITVTSPKPFTNSPIIVLVSNSVTTIMRTLSFVDGFASVETDSYSVPFDATTLDINVQSNLDYTIEIPSSASSWISVKSVTTRATVRNDVITLTVAENNEASVRTATIGLLYDGTTVGSVNICQHSQTSVNNAIAYTTTDSKVVNLKVADALGSNVISNSYNNGRGLIVCESDITTIGDSAFKNCSNLQTIKLPDSVTSIGDYAFRSCSSLISIAISDSIAEIGTNVFQNCSSLTSVTIPNSVTSIGNSVFSGCSSLQGFYGKFASADNRYLVIDDVLKAFAPAGLTESTIPNGVTSIEKYTFEACKSLTSVTIPDSVISIGKGVFSGCSSLTAVYCKPTTPPTGRSDMFYNYVSVGKIYVPTASVEAYKAAGGWKDYADYIEGYDF